MQMQEETMQAMACSERGVDPTLAMRRVAKDVATTVVGVATDLVVATGEDPTAHEGAVAEGFDERELGARLARLVLLVRERKVARPRIGQFPIAAGPSHQGHVLLVRIGRRQGRLECGGGGG